MDSYFKNKQTNKKVSDVSDVFETKYSFQCYSVRK